MANPVLSTTGVCRCGSRLHNKLDFKQSKHWAICRRRGHETLVGPAWVPVQRDFICPCGGLYLPQSAIVVHLPSGTQPILKWYYCPACFGQLQVHAPPTSGARADINPAMLEILRAEESVLPALRKAGPSAVRVPQEIENRFGKRYGALETFARNLILGWPEDDPPPPEHPLRVEFLTLAAKAAHQLL